MIGGIDENPSMRRRLTSSIMYYQDDLTWCVAKSKPKSVWKNLFNLFTLQIWFAVFTIILIFSLLIFIMSRIERKQNNYFWAILVTVSTTVSISSNYYKPNYSSIRSIYMFIMIYGIYLNILIQGLLISVLTTPQSEIQIDSIRHAIDMNFEFAGRKSVLQYYQRNDEVSVIFI